MTNGVETIFCPKYDETTNSFITFNKCGHLICNDCFEKLLLENNNFKTDIKCLLDECNEISYFQLNYLIDFIFERNNDNLKKKYRKQLFIYKFKTLPFYNSIDEYVKYYGILISLYEFIGHIFYSFLHKCKGYFILEIIGIIFAVLLIILYPVIFPFSSQIIIKKYYYSFIRIINKGLIIPIIIGEELLSIIYFFPMIFIHYIYSIYAGINLLIEYCCN